MTPEDFKKWFQKLLDETLYIGTPYNKKDLYSILDNYSDAMDTEFFGGSDNVGSNQSDEYLSPEIPDMGTPFSKHKSPYKMDPHLWSLPSTESMHSHAFYGPRIAPQLAALQDRDTILVFEWGDEYGRHHIQACTWSAFQQGVTSHTSINPDYPPGVVEKILESIIRHHKDPPPEAFHDV